MDDEDEDVIADLEAAVADPAREATDPRPHPGGYLYIDSGFPRRPGDVARLESELLPPSGKEFRDCV